MRKLLTQYIKHNDYFIHADMWNTERFPILGKVINTGLGESNALNIAGGIARNSNTVFVYGVAGFIIHRLEQLKLSCKHFGAQVGKIIILNAGKIGYDSFGIGHSIEDDEDIMKMLDIEFYAPTDLKNLEDIMSRILKQSNGIYYIQLGRDYER